MEEQNSDDWLPPGWTVEVRIRKNGKRDKYYFSPSSVLKFNSKVEVFRYLNSAQNRISIQKISPNVIVEKAMAEGLPPGWEKKTGITTKGDMSEPVTMKRTVSVRMGRNSDLDMIANDQQIPKSTSSGEYVHVPISECISNQCVVGTELTSSVLPQTGSSYQKQGKVGLAQRALVSGCTDDDAQEKQLQENSETEHGTKKASSQDRQSRKRQKKGINLPRRASKRLAGIKVDPVPELKTRNRRVAVKQSGEEETVTNADKSPTSMPDGVAKQFNAKFDYTLDFPLKELLTDPCIAFAIQTLTGETFEITKIAQTSPEFKTSQHSETSAAAAAGAVGEGNVKKSNDGLGDNTFSSPKNLAILQERAGGDTKTNDKAKNENPEPSSDRTLDMSWMDPCIEFAIKTLTGTIPLDSDQNPKNCLQQQLSSSSNQHSEMALSSVSVDNIYQTDYYGSQHFGTQKPVFKQSFVDPPLQRTRNNGVENSAGARLPHCGEDTRRNVC